MLAVHADARGTIGSQAFDAETELRRSGFAWLVANATRLRREDARAIFDDSGGFFRGAITHVVELDLAANRRLGDGIDEIIAGLDGLAVDGVMTSPPLRPAFSAGLPASTPMITTPPLGAPSSLSVMELVPSSSWKLTPIEPRVTRPCEIIWL